MRRIGRWCLWRFVFCNRPNSVQSYTSIYLTGTLRGLESEPLQAGTIFPSLKTILLPALSATAELCVTTTSVVKCCSATR